ncbi:MAG TPA: DUF2520 domain-containing protein [Salinimicrobium sp.]|nr:DUF2520 domain-containing protein [Salinimicrobium sp.]
MINLVLLGTGNIATHLFEAFSASENIQVKQVYNHSEESLRPFRDKTQVTTSLKDLQEADIYIIALKDDVISEVSSQLESKKGIIAHTSGAVSIEALKNCHRPAVFYPLQTFSKKIPVTHTEIPFCLEAKYTADLKIMEWLAKEISGKAFQINSSQRKKLHLAAVFVCNFVNHLYAIGEKICEEHQIPFEIMQALILETAEKVKIASPDALQTGPAVRNDQNTINAHLELLSSPENKEIYQLLTKSIQSLHGKKL